MSNKTIIKVLITWGSVVSLGLICKIILYFSHYRIDYQPIIHLVGESHIDPTCIEFRNRLINKARNNKIILALEGNAFGMVHSNIFGIEEKALHSFVISLLLYQQSILHKIWINCKQSEFNSDLKCMLAECFIDATGGDPLNNFRSIFTALDSLQSEDNKYINDIWNKNPEISNFLLQFDLNKNTEKEIHALTKGHSLEKPFFLKIHPDLSLWMDFVKGLTHLSCVKVMENEDHIPQSIIDQLTIYKKDFEEYANMESEMVFQKLDSLKLLLDNLKECIIFSVAIDERNQIFLKNIINIFESTKGQEKAFYIVVGAKHTPFLYEELKLKGYEIKLNKMAQKAYSDHISKSVNNTNLNRTAIN